MANPRNAAPRVKQTSTTVGTATYELIAPGGATRAFLAAWGNGNKGWYVATDGVNWEVVFGAVTAGTPDTLTRDIVRASSNAGSKINWAAGTRDVFAVPMPGLVPPIPFSGDLTAAVDDIGALYRFTGSGAQTLTLVAVASGGDGFAIHYKNDGSNILTLDGNASETIDGATTLAVNPGEGGSLVIEAGAWRSFGKFGRSSLSMAKAPPELSNNAGDATNDIDIAAGSCRDSTDAANITLAASTKQLDVNWAAGTSGGMRNSAAAIANGTYHLYAVATSAGVSGVYAYAGTDGTDPDSAAAIATMLTALQAETGGAAYVYARRIGSILRESGAIVGFIQRGDTFLRKAPVLDKSAATASTGSATNETISVPKGLRLPSLLALRTNVSNSTIQGVRVYCPDLTDAAVSTTASPLASVVAGGAINGGWTFDNAINGDLPPVITNASRQVAVRGSAALTYYLETKGWIDRRGRDG